MNYSVSSSPYKRECFIIIAKPIISTGKIGIAITYFVCMSFF